MIIDETIELCDGIISRIDGMIEGEYKFNAEMQLQFMKYAREIDKVISELKAIKEMYC